MESQKALPKLRYCCIQSCINSHGTTCDKFHFYKPPMEKHIHDKWKEAISQYQHTKNKTFVCNLHFESESLIEVDGKLFLKYGSIPSIFGNIQLPELKIQKEEVNVDTDPVDCSERVRIVNINKIMQSTSTLNDKPTKVIRIRKLNKVGSSICDGCHKRDTKIIRMNSEIENLMINLDKLKKAYEEKVKQLRYWKSIAQQTKPEMSTELIKVEGLSPEHMEFGGENVFFESEFNKLESVSEAKVESIELVTVDITQDMQKDTIEIIHDQKVDKSTVQDMETLSKPFECNKCSEWFATPKEFLYHMDFLCIYSSKKQQNFSSFSRPPRYECYTCKAEFIVMAKLKKHMEEHTKEMCVVSEMCRVCGYDGGELDQHLCVQGKIDCEFCSQPYTSTNELLVHLESDHSEQKMHQCDRCYDSFRMLFLKGHHLLRKHGITKAFKCDHCEKSFSLQDKLIRHQQRYHKQKPLNCDMCSKSFSNEDSLYRHKRIKHRQEMPKSIHLCDQCGKEFSNPSGLHAHKITHGEPAYKCPDCPQIFRTNDHLKRHSYLHRNETFACVICGAESSSPYALQTHMKRQHNPNAVPIECKICGKKVKNKKNLHRHMQTHASIKMFQCKYCDNSYKYRGDLNKHLKTHLGDKIYECTQPECSERFRLPIELQKHSFKHYKEQQNNKTDTTKT